MIPALTDYYDLLARRARAPRRRGLDQIPDLNDSLFGLQRGTLEFLLGTGSAAAFLDTGLGKTRVELEWGRVVHEHTCRPVLLFAPLAVGPQHVAEARAMGLDAVREVRHQDEVRPGINIANYEMAQHFRPEAFGGVALDESSILKNYHGAVSRMLRGFVDAVDWRLAASATPAPNDYTELGQHAEFLGVMPAPQMLATWFINDTSDTGTWRLKGHAVEDFWTWVTSWARAASKPSDLGFSNEGYDLPPLDVVRDIVKVAAAAAEVAAGGQMPLFSLPTLSATGIHREKRHSAEARARRIAELVTGEPHEPWAVWVETDYEADAVMKLMPADALDVRGGMSYDEKRNKLVAFSSGARRIIVTKASIAGYGLNWQHCARTALGASYSYERYYQLVRRFWRFGQKRPVQAHVVMGEAEQPVWADAMRKAADHEAMKRHMVAAMRRAAMAAASAAVPTAAEPPPVMPALPAWMIGAMQ